MAPRAHLHWTRTLAEREKKALTREYALAHPEGFEPPTF
jgi:hypothetical protein